VHGVASGERNKDSESNERRDNHRQQRPSDPIPTPFMRDNPNKDCEAEPE
jgi:hypothetical protein